MTASWQGRKLFCSHCFHVWTQLGARHRSVQSVVGIVCSKMPDVTFAVLVVSFSAAEGRKTPEQNPSAWGWSVQLPWTGMVRIQRWPSMQTEENSPDLSDLKEGIWSPGRRKWRFLFWEIFNLMSSRCAPKPAAVNNAEVSTTNQHALRGDAILTDVCCCGLRTPECVLQSGLSICCATSRNAERAEIPCKLQQN